MMPPVIIELHDGYTVTKIPGCKPVTARHDPQPGQVEIAAGMGCSVEEMNRSHDLLHSLVAHWLRLPASPVLKNAGSDYPGDHELLGLEEDAVMALHRFMVALKIEPLSLLK